MADKMMRMAGRGEDGTAKAIKTNNLGRLEVKNNITRQLFPRRTFVGKEVYETSVRDAEGYQYTTFHFVMINGFKLYIQYYRKNWQNEYIPFGEKELVYTGGLHPDHHKINVALKSNYYSVVFENTDSTGTYFNDDNFETLTDFPIKEINEVEEDVSKDDNIIDVVTKKPTSFLQFKDTKVNSRTFCRGYDDYFYVVDNNGNLKKFEELNEGAQPVENGINLWDSIGIDGRLSYLFHTPDGFTFFVNYNEDAYIYHSNDINSNPSKVYESNTATESVWSSYFGVKGYCNGLESIILAGSYGYGQEKRDLVLSVDGGKTFKIIKQTKNTDSSGTKNSHWHDVAFDPYHGIIWAVEGDGLVNQDIYYSYDFGETWKVLPNENNIQPTGLAVFPERVVMGRDSDYAGLDYLSKPQTLEDGFKSPKVLKELKDTYGAYYYAKSPLVMGDEAYMSFFLYGDTKVPVIIGTGDFGYSWHGLFFGNKNIGNFIAADDAYLYATDEYFTTILKAKKPKWVE